MTAPERDPQAEDIPAITVGHTGATPVQPFAAAPTVPVNLLAAADTPYTHPAQANANLLPIGSDFLGYTVVRLLGSGGMGLVYEARQEQLTRGVALKLLRPEVAAKADFSERFLRECKAMAAVSHPNVVAIFDAGTHGGFLYMVLELMAGGDLARLLARRGRIEPREAIELLTGCAQGLGAIHAAGLVHRDIKPQNIFLDRALQPKIGDLGLARAADGADRVTLTGAAWGTPAYMSPEQVRGVGDIDIRSDIYALGATLYTLLTGSEPFAGATTYIVTHKVLSEPTPDPRLHDRTIPAALAAVVLRAMAKDRDERYRTPQELVQDLEHVRQGKPLLHALIVPAPAVAAPPAAAAGTTAAIADPAAHAASHAPGAQAQGAVAAASTFALGTASLPTAPRPVGGFAPSRGGGGGGGLLAFGLLFKVAALGLVIGVLYAVYNSMSGFHGDAVRRHAAVENAPWASAGGSDDYGRWADLTLRNSLAMRFRWIPAGSFTMGSPLGEPGRGSSETLHTVSISHGFWLGESTCTRQQWDHIHDLQSAQPQAEYPQTGIDLEDCENAVKLLSAAIAPAVARLPSEAEWEYACRARTNTPFSCGARITGFGFAASGVVAAAWSAHAGEPNPLPAIDADLAGKSGDPDIGCHLVRQLRPNSWGLYDMHGNALEWCEDAWDGTQALPSAPQTDPLSTDGAMVVGRGGSWHQLADACRSAARTALQASAKEDWLGMRILICEPGAGALAATPSAPSTP